MSDMTITVQRRANACDGAFAGAFAGAVLMLAFAAARVDAAQAGAAWRLQAEPLLTIGRVDGPAEELFNSIAGALRLRDGRYVIADGAELRLSVHAPDGRLLSAWGRSGAGPGEFRSILGLWNPGADTIAVWDPRLQRITRLRPDGSVIRTDALFFGPEGPPGGRMPDGFFGTAAGGRVILAWISTPRRVPDRLLPDTMTFGLFDPAGRFLRVIGSEIGMLRTVVPATGGGPFVFSPFPWSAIVRDTLVYTNGLDGVIHFFDPAASHERAVRTLRVPGRALSLEQAWRALDAALPGSGAQPFPVSLIRATDRSLGQVPHYARMFADDRGRIWLKEFDPARDALLLRGGLLAAGGRWRIVDTTGRPVATLSMPDNASPIAVLGDDLLAVLRDELDVERFAVYRIVR